jgi:GT2 family glycosyltransferase
VFEPAIKSFLEGASNGVLVIADNSPAPLVSPYFQHERVHYIHTGQNLGFGKAHNFAFENVQAVSDVHLILNPDIVFGEKILPYLIDVMEINQRLGAIMPQIRYPDGKLQRLCKLLPTPADLLFRRFIPIKSFVDARNKVYEMHDLSQRSRSIVPTLSGCFLLVRSEILREIRGFDERYFMYLEDVDLVRRIGERGEVIYDPTVFVVHAYGKGSYRNFKLLSYHIKSAIKYFNKWGWFWDPVRRKSNRAALQGMSVVTPSMFANDYAELPMIRDPE